MKKRNQPIHLSSTRVSKGSWLARHRKILTAGVAAASIGLPAPALADVTPDAGVFLGYRWGGNGNGFEWGFEGGVVANYNELFPVYGGNIQISFKNLEAPTVVAALTGGSYFGGGELGLAYRFGDDGGFGLHMGLMGQFIGTASIRYKTHLDDLSVNAGIRFPSSFGLWFGGMGAHGRPLRTDEGFSKSATIKTEPGHDAYCGFSHLDKQAMEELWLHKAQAEWLSVPAFDQIAKELEGTGAPEELVTRTHRAKADEIKHTLLTGGIAAMATGKSITIEEPDQTYRPALEGNASLMRLALESWTDGCLHEGLAAREVQEQAQNTANPAIKEVLSQIAKEELTHENLAWDVIQWALQEGGPEIKKALQATLMHRPKASGNTPEENSSLQNLGALSKQTRTELYNQHLGESRARLQGLL